MEKTTNSKPGWGGKRPGSGPKKTGRKSRHYYVTDHEHSQLGKYLKVMRKAKPKPKAKVKPKVIAIQKDML